MTVPATMRLRSVYDYCHSFGLWNTLGAAAYHASSLLFPYVYHQQQPPSLTSLAIQAEGIYSTPEPLLTTLGIPTHDVRRYSSEYALLRDDLLAREHSVKRMHPSNFAIETNTALTLYAIVRFCRPTLILETGVANGRSTYLFLKALSANGRGELHSIDVSADVAAVLSDEDKRGWHLHLLDLRHPSEAFADIVTALPPIDCFVHDSDHTYRAVSRELRQVWDRLSDQAVIGADDIDESHAFADFCTDHALPMHALFDRRKIFGLTIKASRRLTPRP